MPYSSSSVGAFSLVVRRPTTAAEMHRSAPSNNRSSSLSPTPSDAKATAVFRKRRREDRSSYERPEPVGRLRWPVADELYEDDPTYAPAATSSLRDIQRCVDKVGAQVAQAQRNVAELKQLLTMAIARQREPRAYQLHPTRPMLHRPSMPSLSTRVALRTSTRVNATTVPASPATSRTSKRMRIDSLCS
ncbi:hypothetical protein PINS_up015962 [Pythium insidiosum]|nr:hypothetical protein PINS_up015962 [Pythium insidiosum]